MAKTCQNPDAGTAPVYGSFDDAFAEITRIAQALYLIQHYASLFTNANDACYYYIFSKSGFTDALLEKQEKGDAMLITLEEMYGGK